MNIKDKSQLRHILKAITWRVIASFTTFILALIFFYDDPQATEKATGVAVAESILKIFFYYVHERVWFKVRLGRKNTTIDG